MKAAVEEEEDDKAKEKTKQGALGSEKRERINSIQIAQ